MATEAPECPGGTCDGSGIILGPPQCSLACAPLRHADECGRRAPARCPACARAELGEDLGSP